ncbi:aldo/keto reductase [Cetobacterium sp.]|uniref:aldo/keto reductase n=1 Tax=Cetobacterium sp. TaxID=2071632 RepID=UPI003F3E7EF2
MAYAWLLAHPTNMIPICGSGKIDRLKSAVKSLDVQLTREEWFEIFVTGMGKNIP